jgi:hypothetical protein
MLKKLLISLALITIQVPSYAEALVVTSKIRTIFLGPQYSQVVFIGVVSRPTSARPLNCGANSDFDFVIDLSSKYGKEYYSTLLAAYAAQKTVRLVSYDTCNLHPNVPDLASIWLK